MISNTFHSKLQLYYLCFIVLLFSRLLFLFIYKLLEKYLYSNRTEIIIGYMIAIIFNFIIMHLISL